jgi:hypothetical protein
MPGHAVKSEEGIQEGTEHAPLRGPCVEDQCGECVVNLPLPPGGSQEVQDQVAEGSFVPGSAY